MCGILDPVILKRQMENPQNCDKFAENGFVSTLVFFLDLTIVTHLSQWLSPVIRQKQGLQSKALKASLSW